MSKLTIKGNLAAVINPMFYEQYKLLAESDGGHNGEIVACNPYLNYKLLAEENETIKHMALFMLEERMLMGVKWGTQFYYGDVDLMDMYDSSYLKDEGTIQLQFELEDEVLYPENMNCLQEAERRIEHGEINAMRPAALYLAWLQFHIENPGLHPDDYLNPTGGYEGWHVLLTHEVWRTKAGGNEILMHPGFILTFVEWTIENLKTFHTDEEDKITWNMADSLSNRMHDLHTTDLDNICHMLDELVCFHDGSPEDIFENLSDTAEVFNWIKSKK